MWISPDFNYDTGLYLLQSNYNTVWTPSTPCVAH